MGGDFATKSQQTPSTENYVHPKLIYVTFFNIRKKSEKFKNIQKEMTYFCSEK